MPAELALLKNVRTDADDVAAITQLHNVFANQKAAYFRDPYPAFEARIEALEKLEALLVDHQKVIGEAVNSDFGNHPQALTRLVEIMPAVLRARHARKNLKKWMKVEKRPINRLLFGLAKNRMFRQPKGVIGNMSPWNFPFDISLGPVVDMLAAGNRVIIKPSEITAHSSNLLAELIGKTFSPDQVAVINGGLALAEAFITLPWDHLVYTGGPQIGKKVMKAAAENLTPVTLELGGKCPTLFAGDSVTPKNVASFLGAKGVKSGQMCIAPDYVFVPTRQLTNFIELAETSWNKLYPDELNNPDVTALVNDRHYRRVLSYLEEAKARGVELTVLGKKGDQPDQSSRKIPLTLAINPPADIALSTHEIFGPILPVITYEQVDQVVKHIQTNERPLAFYIYAQDRVLIDHLMRNTISGAVCINASATHGLQADLPFGGIGQSGIGHHHGFDGFCEFSKQKPVFEQAPLDASAILFPPYGRIIQIFLNQIIGKFRG